MISDQQSHKLSQKNSKPCKIRRLKPNISFNHCWENCAHDNFYVTLILKQNKFSYFKKNSSLKKAQCIYFPTVNPFPLYQLREVLRFLLYLKADITTLLQRWEQKYTCKCTRHTITHPM